MRKSGLHKQISSIFDGAPVPNQGQPAKPEPDAAETNQTLGFLQADEPLETQQPSKPVAKTTDAPKVPSKRPKPLPKKNFNNKASKANLSKMVQKSVFGAHKKPSAQQQKMTVLVGILSIVFGVVLYVSLGGVGQSQIIADEKDDGATTPATASALKVKPETWTLPEPIPNQLRDVTKPEATVALTPDEPEQTTESVQPAEPEKIELHVKGIVYSKTNPTAIINGKIYAVGESIGEIEIIEITRDDVMFEGNGECWTQQVQR